jgi:hypothetical protein
MMFFEWMYFMPRLMSRSTAITSAFLVWEHRLVQVDNLDYLDMAFFTLNGWISMAILVAVTLERVLQTPLLTLGPTR